MKKKMPSGAELEIQMASFADAKRLLDEVMREVEAVDVRFGGEKGLKEVLQSELTSETLNTVKNLLARLISSPPVGVALGACFGRCTYNNAKIGPDSFEPEAARGDYLAVVKEVLVFNLAPFFKGAGSLFAGLLDRASASQK